MMNYVWNWMKAKKKDESGFTLIELLIVILILGILAAIAIFASAPFRERAVQACNDANVRIQYTAEAAIDAGVDGTNIYEFAPGDCAAGGAGVGGGGGGGTPVTASLVRDAVDATASNPATVTWAAPTAGNLLVAVSAHRQNVSGADPGTPTLAGWQLRGIADFMQDGTSDRRAIAVFTKIADGSETSMSVSWAGAGITTTSLVVSEYSTTGTLNFSFNAVDGTAATVTSLNLGAASGNVIAGIVLRDGPGALTWSGASSTESQLTSGIGTHLAFGSGPVSATWAGAAFASGFTLNLGS